MPTTLTHCEMSTEQWQKMLPIEKLVVAEAVSHNPVIITACMSLSENVFEGDHHPYWLRRVFLPRLLRHPRFKSRLVGDNYTNYRFVPIPDFHENSADLHEHHISLEDVINPGKTWKEREVLFTERLSEIMSTPLDLRRPLWKAYFFPAFSMLPDHNGNTPDSCMVVVRVHHCIGDGVGLVKYFSLEMTDNECATPSTLLIVPERQKAEQSGLTQHQLDNARTAKSEMPVNMPVVQRPSVFQRLYEMVEDVYNSSIRLLIPDPESTFNRSQIQESKVCALLPPTEVSVDMVKNAARLLGVTFNDLLFTAISGATRAYLVEYNDNPDELKDLRVGIPFNGHMLDEFKMMDVSNQLAIVPMSLHVQEQNRLQRLRTCVSQLRRVKRSFQPMLLMGLLKVVSLIPTGLGLVLWRRLTKATSILFTNVPGPKEVVKMGGISISGLHFFAPSDGHIGVVAGLFSYAGKIAIGVSGDKGRIANPQRFVQLLLEEIRALIQMGMLN